MKIFYTTICFSILLMLASCQKEFAIVDLPKQVIDSASGTTPATNPGNNDYEKIYRITQGVLADTVRLLTYDSLNRLSSIIDSTYHDTTRLSYNTDGTLMKVENGAMRAIYTYDANGKLLTQIDAYAFGEHSQCLFEYGPDSLPTRKIYKSNHGSGDVKTWRISNYTFNASRDLVNIKELTESGTLTEEKTISYSNLPNNYKLLHLANMYNYFGFEHLFNCDYFFSNHLVSNVTTADAGPVATTANVYTFDTSNNITNAVTDYIRGTDTSTSKKLTLHFYY